MKHTPTPQEVNFPYINQTPGNNKTLNYSNRTNTNQGHINPSHSISGQTATGPVKKTSVLKMLKESSAIDRKHERFRRMKCSTLAKLLNVIRKIIIEKRLNFRKDSSLNGSNSK